MASYRAGQDDAFGVGVLRQCSGWYLLGTNMSLEPRLGVLAISCLVGVVMGCGSSDDNSSAHTSSGGGSTDEAGNAGTSTQQSLGGSAIQTGGLGGKTSAGSGGESLDPGHQGGTTDGGSGIGGTSRGGRGSSGGAAVGGAFASGGETSAEGGKGKGGQGVGGGSGGTLASNGGAGGREEAGGEGGRNEDGQGGVTRAGSDSGGGSAGGSEGGGTAGQTHVGGSADTGGGSGLGGSGGDAGRGGVGGFAGAAGAPDDTIAATCRTWLDEAVAQYDGFRKAYTDPTEIPRSAKGGSVSLVGVSDWTSGFPAGSFWILYEHTGDPSWLETARTWTSALDSQKTRTSDHDIGFIINNTFGRGYRLTGDEAYRSVVLTAAGSLATRYSDTVKAIRSWDFGSWQYPVIIDNMMNLELLFDATRLGGDARFENLALAHATTTMANHFRADYSSYHVVDYDAGTGAVRWRGTNQGIADDSDWARGQAWGLYGYTMTYRETGESRFLEHAMHTADFYSQDPSMPADGVPYFDFDAITRDDVPDYRDTSAGAIAASGLFELAELTRTSSPEASARYREFAVRSLRSLAGPDYRAELGENSHFLLAHAVGNYPINGEVDVAINYADYYYLEALLRCSALSP